MEGQVLLIVWLTAEITGYKMMVALFQVLEQEKRQTAATTSRLWKAVIQQRLAATHKLTPVKERAAKILPLTQSTP